MPPCVRAALAGLLLLFALGQFAVLHYQPRPVGDEPLHHGFAIEVARGRATVEGARERMLPMIPTWHAALGLGGRLLGTGLHRMRVLNGLFLLLLIPALWWAAGPAPARERWPRLLLPLAIPWLGPTGWLLYTDVAALLPLVLAFASWRRGKEGVAGWWLFAATALRQNSAVWAGALWLIGVIEDRGKDRPFAEALRRAIRLAPGPGLLLAFWVWNGDLALWRFPGAPRSLHLSQLVFATVVPAVVWLPAVAADLGRQLRAWRRPGLVRVLGLGAWVALALAARNDHPWNLTLSKAGGSIDLDDVVAAAIFHGPGTVLAAALVGWCTLEAVIRVDREGAAGRAVLLGVTLVSLIPLWLLNFRYLLPPMVLLPLAGLIVPPRATIAWSALLAAALIAAFLSGHAFW